MYPIDPEIQEQELEALGIALPSGAASIRTAASPHASAQLAPRMAGQTALQPGVRGNRAPAGISPYGGPSPQPSRRASVRRIPFDYRVAQDFDENETQGTQTITIGSDGGFTCWATKAFMFVFTAADAPSAFLPPLVRVRDGSSGQEFMNDFEFLNLYTDIDVVQAVSQQAAQTNVWEVNRARNLQSPMILRPNSQLIVDFVYNGILQEDENIVTMLSFIGYRTFVDR